MQRIFIPLLMMVIGSSCRPDQKKNAELANGREIYIANCISCHQDNGNGLPGLYPTLLKPSGIVEAQTHRAVRLIKFGSGYENGMKPIPLTNAEIAEVVNYIQNSWGNESPLISVTQVESLNTP